MQHKTIMHVHPRTQAGFIHLVAIGLIALIVLLVFIFFLIVVGGKSAEQASIANDEMMDFDKAEGEYQIDPALIGLRRLRCVVLPGVDRFHTRALDVRVARGYWKPAYEEMRQRNIPITINYGFRNVCEQLHATANAGGNQTCKWPNCLSPHMAGRAIDVNGIGTTSSGGKSVTAAQMNPILQILTKHGWRWIGPSDWPHFDIQSFQVNDTSDYAQWVAEIQLFWKRQQEAGGGSLANCMGGQCGEFYTQMKRIPAYKKLEVDLAAAARQSQQNNGGSSGKK